MVKWVESKLWGVVIACCLWAGAPLAHSQTISCTDNVFNTCSNNCRFIGDCIYGCTVGQSNDENRCYANCNGLAPTCLDSCLQTIQAIQSCFTVGGTVSGLGAGKSAVLQNNGGDNLTVDANGSFTFATTIMGGSNYQVTVLTQPIGQTCVVGNGSGTVDAYISNADVSNVSLTCYDNVVTGSTPGGQVTAAITGGSCSGYEPGSTSFTTPINPPAGQTFPYGVFGFTALNCNDGGTVTITLTYPNNLPPGTKYWKYIDGTWVDWTGFTTISGNTIALTLTDGAYGDTNPNPGVISDPSGPAYDSNQAIPTLSEWGIIILSGLLALCIPMAIRLRQEN